MFHFPCPYPSPYPPPLHLASAVTGLVFAGSLDGFLYAVDLSTGTFVWSKDFGSPIYGSPALGLDGQLFLGCDGGRVLALEASSGAAIWSHTVPDSVRSSPAVTAAGTIVFGCVWSLLPLLLLLLMLLRTQYTMCLR